MSDNQTTIRQRDIAELKIVRGAVREVYARLRAMGLRTVGPEIEALGDICIDCTEQIVAFEPELPFRRVA